MKLYPSLISADILNLAQVLNLFDSECDGYHIDVMDDHFVPNLTWGPTFVQEIIKKTRLPVSIHLMVDEPARWCNRLNLRKEDILIAHYEVFSNKQDIKNFMSDRACGGLRGIALNPETSVASIREFLALVDTVLVMTVNPGFSGQNFLSDNIKKIKFLSEYKSHEHGSYTIGVDGGLNDETIQDVCAAGATWGAVASGIFSQSDPVKALKKLYLLTKGR
jgi:ribulose-phosphate 3-epimerase